VLADSGNVRESEDSFRQAVKIQKDLTTQQQNVPEYRKALARAQVNLGAQLAASARQEGARLTEGEEVLDAARSICRKLVSDYLDVPEYRQELARSLVNLAAIYREQGGDGKRLAEDAFREALALRERLVQECPSVLRYRQELARSHNFLGRLLEGRDRAAAAEEEYRTALDIQKQLLTEHPNVPMYHNDVGTTLNNLGEFYLHRQKWEEARQQFKEALEQEQRALDGNARHPQFRRSYLRDAGHLADALARLKDHTALMNLGEELLVGKVTGPEVQLQAARTLARSLPMILKDDTLPQEERELLVSVSADRAMGLLGAAVAKGLKDLARLKTDPQLASLRKREEFRKLVP
jgi:tetratricopeptide (TPR) repeat protein